MPIEVFGAVILIVGVFALWEEQEDRADQRLARMWALGTDDRPGNSGKIPALEFLNKNGHPLTGISIKKAYLVKIDLRDAKLGSANLGSANLGSAKLGFAKLGDANLWCANLRGADLTRADLGGANLKGADLGGADLRMTKNLTPSQLDQTCGDKNTKLPKGLTIKPCEESRPVVRQQRCPREVPVCLDQPHLVLPALDDHRPDMRPTEPRSGYREDEASRHVGAVAECGGGGVTYTPAADTAVVDDEDDQGDAEQGDQSQHDAR